MKKQDIKNEKLPRILKEEQDDLTYDEEHPIQTFLNEPIFVFNNTRNAIKSSLKLLSTAAVATAFFTVLFTDAYIKVSHTVDKITDKIKKMIFPFKSPEENRDKKENSVSNKNEIKFMGPDFRENPKLAQNTVLIDGSKIHYEISKIQSCLSKNIQLN